MARKKKKKSSAFVWIYDDEIFVCMAKNVVMNVCAVRLR